MAGFFLHKPNGRLFASTVVNGEVFTVDAKELRADEIDWTIGGSYYQDDLPFLIDKLDLEELSLTMGNSISPEIAELDPFIKANKISGISLVDCPLHKIGHFFNEWLKKKIIEAQKFLESLTEEDIEFGLTIVNSRRRILNNMGSFLFDGKNTKIDWSIFSQKAGRMSIESGFNPMVLKKTERHRVSSIKSNRSIIYCDFKALEFRIALKAFNCKEYEDVEDPYASIAEEIELQCNDRSEYKNAMIALLYGSSLKGSKLPDEDKIKLIQWFDENINTKRLIEEGLEDYHDHGFIRSIFGRRIYQDEDINDKMIINNIFQASGADFAFLSYSKLVDSIKMLGINARPIFMIHDSIIFDASEKAIESLFSIGRINGYPVEWGFFAE